MVKEKIDKYLDIFDDPEDKVDIVSEEGIMLFKDAVVKDLFEEGDGN